MGQNCEWEMQQIQARLKKIEEQIEQDRITLLGDTHTKGIITKVALTGERVENLDRWRNAWLGTTNIEEYKTLRNDVRFLMRWNWLIFGGLAIISVILQFVGPSLVKAF